MHHSLMGFLSSGKLIAMATFLMTFPPVLTSFGTSEALRLSLSILIFYLLRGLFKLTLEIGILLAAKPKEKISSPTTLSSTFNILNRAVCIALDTIKNV